jgi:hypothetical protein
MFRYGGPIKEGVMSGIREPKKNGGMLLVGQHPKEFKDASGREKHVAPLVVGAGMGLARLAPLAMRAGPAAMRYGRKGVQAFKNLFGSNVPKTVQVPKAGPTSQGSVVSTYSKGYPGTMRTQPVGPGTGPQTVNEFVPNKFGSYLADTMSGKAAIGLYKGATSPTAVGLTQKAGKAIWSVAKDPITIASAAYYFYPDGTPKSDEELEMQGPPPPGGLEKLLTDTDNKGAAGSGAELSPKEKRAAQVEKYRDIMDIKGMNKEAAYDSLIAASQAVNQAGGDLKGAIKDGSLINQIIQSTSKAFDKPKKTKDAIDTLILKGEIEKDIKASDPANKILNEYRLKQMQKIDKDLNTGFAEAKIAASKNLSGQSAIDAAASVASENFKGNLLTKKQLTDVMEAAKGSGEISEQDIIISATTEVIKDKNLPDGDYTVGDVLVTIQEGQVVDIKR